MEKLLEVLGPEVAGRVRFPPTAKAITHVALVFDKSGSMAGVKDKARSSINEQIQELKRLASDSMETFVTLVTFNGFVDVSYVNTPVSKVSEIGENQYNPNGSTALNDALKTAIEALRLNARHVPNEAFLVVVVTDGEENASYIPSDLIKSYIKELETTKQWTFTYMLSNLDVVKFKHVYGAMAGNVSTFTTDSAGMGAMSASIGSSLRSFAGARQAGETAVEDFYGELLNDPDKIPGAKSNLSPPASNETI